MRLKKFGRLALAIAASAGAVGLSSCGSYTSGYMFVTGAQYGQIATYKIDHDTGKLTQSGSYVASNGTNPTQAIVAPGGRFLYVLTNGCGLAGQMACPSGSTGAEASKINLFSIGGSGSLTFQISYASQGQNTKTIVLNSAGTFLYALDNLAPDGSGQGDITAFSVDTATGRLSTVTNQQNLGPNGTALPYFKVGTNPTWFSFASAGTYLYTIEQGPAVGTAADPKQAIFIYSAGTDGQLTLTQNAPLPTGATQLTYIAPGGTNLYALDTGPAGSPGLILPYSVNTTGGSLQSVLNGATTNTAQGNTTPNPSYLTSIKGTTNTFLYVANAGPNVVVNTPAATVTSYQILPTPQLGVLSPLGNSSATTPFPAGVRCLVIDPTSQFLYSVGNNSTNGGNVSGYQVDRNAGILRDLQKGIGISGGPGNATWCAVSATTF